MSRIDKFIIAINAVGMVFSTFAAIVNYQSYRPFWIGVFATLAVLNAASIIALLKLSLIWKQKRKNDPVEFQTNMCPEFPFFGASYPDACCIDGRLYDLDKCDENGNLYVPTDYDYCPFCHPKEFMEQWDMTQEEFDKFINPLRERYGKKNYN